MTEEAQVGRKPRSAEVRATYFTARSSGATLKEAAAAAGVSRTTGHYWLTQSGGVRPRRRMPRPALRLSLQEREVISRGLAQRRTMTSIAAELGRSVSSVSRQITRSSGVDGYRAVRADRLAVARTARPRAGRLAEDPVLRGHVEDEPACRWSPQQTGERLGLDFPADAGMRLSHETTCTSLFVQAKAVLPGGLTAQLRTRRVRRRPQRRVKGPQGPGRIPQITKIAERPGQVLDRTEPGHWEGDLPVGRYGRRHLAALVGRHSRYLLVLPLPDARSSSVTARSSTPSDSCPRRWRAR